MKTIAVDIDDVLADNAAGFVDYSNKKWGTSLKIEDYDEHWAEVWKIDSRDVVEARAAEYLQNAPRHFKYDDEALPVLRRLSKDYRLQIVTSRRIWMKNDTEEWIDKHYPGIFNEDTIHFAGIWDDDSDHAYKNMKTKADVVERIQADFLIDDQLKHCLAVAENNRKALLFGQYNWNQSNSLPENVTRVDDWQAVEQYFYGT